MRFDIGWWSVRLRKSLSFVLLTLLWITRTAYALSPMGYYNSLVAGGDDPGYRDGDFSSARFNDPGGIAFDASGERLFVADTNNHRIRLVHLDDNNRVETLVGTGTPGHEDGPFSVASFNEPTALAFVPPEQLVVFDSGDQFLRIIDLKNRKVTTVAGGAIGATWNLVYLPKEGNLYISQPAAGRVLRLDWKTQKITTVLANSALVPHPKALALYQGSLFLADRVLPGVYRIDSASDSTPSNSTVLVKAGKGAFIQELASSDDILYALQSGPIPLVRILPENSPVSLITPWGFFVENSNPLVEPFLNFQIDTPVGFAASPKEARKLFISRPTLVRDCLYSVEDYHFDNNFLADSPEDFNFPTKKPPQTFRILVLGDSRAVRATTYVPALTARTPNLDVNKLMTSSVRMNTFSKQLEFYLNREAAIEGVKTRFEVIMFAHVGETLTDYINYDAPSQIQKYDVDLVLGLAGWSGYDAYFQRPITSKGIPVERTDPEYLLKPLSMRIPSGAPARFYKRCIEKGLIKKGQSLPDGNPSGCVSLAFFHSLDAEMRDDLMEMDGRVLKLFQEKLGTLTTSAGTRPKFLVFFVPWRDFRPDNDDYESYWRELCGKNQIGFLDLSSAFYALEPSFYPTNDAILNFHYNEYGHTLIAYLLSHYLPVQKWIPFTSAFKTK